MLKRRLVGDRYVLAPGQQLRGERAYRIDARVAGGAFSIGYRGRGEQGEACFIKEFLPPLFPSERAELRRIFEQECDVLRRIGTYELCPRLWDAFESCGFGYLVQDFIPGQDLDTLLGAHTKFDEETLIRWSLSLCHALAFLHSRNVVHHDLKPANVRMNADGDPVLVDFGAARWYRSADEKSEILYGTEGFLAPEYAAAGGEDLAAGMRMDVFALGRILVELLVGERMTQAEIDRRQDEFYGRIVNRATLDINFVRAIFRAVSYKPELRYASALEMQKDLEAAAPAIARRRPSEIDLGVASDTRPREAVLTVYNAGGGSLQGEVSTDVDWLEVGVEGASTSRREPFERNRQSVRVVAFPERLPAGAAVQGRVIVTCQSGSLGTTVSLRRALDLAQVTAQPDPLRLAVKRGQEARATLTFRNRGPAAVRVRLVPPASFPVTVAPETFELPPDGQVPVVVSVEGALPEDEVMKAPLAWYVEEMERPPVTLELATRAAGGLMANVLRRGPKGG
jgi:serine/threonine protein kinase